MNELRKVAALNGNLKRGIILAGAGAVYSLASMTSAHAEDMAQSTDPQSTLDAAVADATPYQVAQNTSSISDAQSAIDMANTAAQVAAMASSDVATASEAVGIASSELTIAQNNLSSATADVVNQQAVVDAATTEVANKTVDVANTTQAVIDQTAVVATDTQAVTDATTVKAAADAVVSANTTPGLQVTVYSDPAYSVSPPVGAGTIVNQGVVPNVDFNWGSGRVMGGPSDRVQVHFTGQFTPNQTGTMWLTPQADDGTILTIGGTTINDWRDKGNGGGTLTLPTVAGVPQSFNLWYYENGGGAFVKLYWYTGNGWQIVPASAFSQSNASATQIAAAQDAATTLNNLVSTLNSDQALLSNYIDAQANASSALANAQYVLTTETQTLNTLQAVQSDAQAIVDIKQSAMDDATAAFNTATAVYETAAATAQSLTNVANDKVATAVAAISATPTAAPRPVREYVAPTPQPTPQPQPTPSDNPSSTSTDSQATQTTPSSTGSSGNGQTSSTQTSTGSSQSSTGSQTTGSTTSTSPSTSPNSLPTTVPLVPTQDLLVAHIQQDVAGAQNGGIQFFGTQSQPQVIGEDGKLTPPPPPPGSGLPIPPEAITTKDTFIGQPGGTTFNAPDVAVPVEPIVVSVPVPGAQALADAYVAMANIGNDMSPVTRKKAKKILVATVIGGAIVRMRRKF